MTVYGRLLTLFSGWISNIFDGFGFRFVLGNSYAQNPVILSSSAVGTDF